MHSSVQVLQMKMKKQCNGKYKELESYVPIHKYWLLAFTSTKHIKNHFCLLDWPSQVNMNCHSASLSDFFSYNPKEKQQTGTFSPTRTTEY